MVQGFIENYCNCVMNFLVLITFINKESNNQVWVWLLSMYDRIMKI